MNNISATTGAAIDRLRVLIIGAGRGGSALLRLCMSEDGIEVAGIVDSDCTATGLNIAKDSGIPVYVDAEAALRQCSPCLVFNMTRDQAISELALTWVDSGSVIGGHVAQLFWAMIMRLQATQDQLRESQARMHAVIYNVREGIISVDSRGIIEYVNPAIERVFGYAAAELVGRNVSMLAPEPHRGAHDGYIENYLRTGESSVVGHSREVSAVHKDGHKFPIELNLAEMELDGVKHFVGLTRDITDRKALEEHMTRLALYDGLTGLPNRMMFLKELNFILAQKRRMEGAVAVLFIDLDGFKSVNDEQGHDAGDAVLKEVGKRLKSCLRESDVAARIGGDEFMAVLSYIRTGADATMVCDRFLGLLQQSIDVQGGECRVGASIGIAVYPENGKDAETLIKNADDAMYSAKAGGKNRFCYAQPASRSTSMRDDAFLGRAGA